MFFSVRSHPFHLPQHDGPVDDDTEGVSASESATGDVPPQPSSDTHLTREKIDAMLLAVDPAALRPSRSRKNLSRASVVLPQTDGANDDDDDDEDDPEEPGGGGGGGGTGDSVIGSDLDESESEDEYAEVSNLLLCQFEKVQRVKNKWKCALKDGVINVNGKDYLFSKANCDFEW
eukprot:jgi/Hompol1/360/HPOL_001093-RA